ncbi:hypothetical protein [Obesumbacterium proteus]|uniref:hypothetical protein n=1 Tax=Obesumbacterium proteus TaxID=82983 RepID=UPI001F3B5591|nr:hypothetical protein [Obesumbacterium proteus]MCE9884858.1 hypothetical protein [Obesumbacterium proteus]MCE9914996.1 hypothetical protein [Obesumbacterium proteus]MCE9931061.1 hypothetical protein [Obesumbacterium proteus]MCG2875234.1 hypothetical protein [Obesumbacterium proteus]
MSDHECRGECQCKKVVIPVIFVPDILGTRLSNARDHKAVWDPMAGMGSYHTPLGTAAIDLSGMITKQTAMANASPLVKKLLALQEKLTQLHGALMALYQMSQKIAKALGLNSLSKRLEGASTDAVSDTKETTTKLKAQLAEIKTKIAHIEKELTHVFEAMGKAEDILRIGRNVWGAISVLEWMFRDASKRREMLVGDSRKVIGRDDSLLEISQDATKGSADTLYFSTMTSVRVQDIDRRFKQGWGEVCWHQYGEFLMTLQRHLDARFNIKDVSVAGQNLPGDIPQPVMPTGKALKDLLAAIEALFDFGDKSASKPAAATAPKTVTSASTPAPAPSAEPTSNSSKQSPLPWGADANFAKVMGGYAFPLHVVGFNWMQGCADGAQRLTTRIAQIMAMYKTSDDGGDGTWMTKKPVEKVLIISHGAGGQVVRAMLADLSPETWGGASSATSQENLSTEGGGRFDNHDAKENPEQAAADKNSLSSTYAAIKKATPSFNKEHLLKAVHVGLPINGMPDIYCWFRAGMQTPVSVDWSKPDQAAKDKTLAYISNQVLGANAAEITMVLSYSQSALEVLPNNSYETGWICYQPPSISLVEGEKAPAPMAMAVEENIYAEYQNNKHWYQAINGELLCSDPASIKHNFSAVADYLKRTSAFYSTLGAGGLDKTQQLSGKNSKPISRDKAVWQAQSVTPPGTPDSWQKFGQRVANASGLLNGIDSVLGTQLFSSLADSGQGTLYLTGATASLSVLPTEFVLQKGSNIGDGELPLSAAKGATEVECSEYHDSLYQDEKIRAAIYKELQTASWAYNAEISAPKK